MVRSNEGSKTQVEKDLSMAEGWYGGEENSHPPGVPKLQQEIDAPLVGLGKLQGHAR